MMNLDDLAAKIDKMHELTLIGVKEMLTIKECALFTGLCVSYLRQLKTKRVIPYYNVGDKIYFKKSEIHNWMQSNRHSTDDELKRIVNNKFKHK